VSARTGAGLAEVERAIAKRAAGRAAAAERLAADVEAAAAGLEAGCAGARSGRMGRGERERLVAALAEAAGVPTVVRAVDRAHRRRGALRTGWPAARWARRLRPDPLRRLRLPDRGGDADTRPSLPAPTSVQRARVSTATRALAASVAGDLPDPWPRLAREAATRNEDRAAETLAATMGDVDLRMTEPLWWRVVNALQLVLVAAMVAGVLWLLALAALGWLRLDDVVPTPEVEGVAIPTLLTLGGALAGVLVALLAAAVTRIGARRRARRAERALRARVEAAAAELVVAPVTAEVAARDELCAALATARGTKGRRGR
jgi:hypothetical protein